MENQAFGRWLQHQLDRRQWNQSELSRRAKVSTSAVSAWVKGERIPDPASCDLIADVSALAGDVAMLAAFAPDRLAAIMRAHGITAQLHDGGVRLVWPESLRYFFER